MAAIAVVIVKLSTLSLLRIEAEFGVRLTALDVAPHEGQKGDHSQGHANGRENPCHTVHEGQGIPATQAQR
jgi:hypothetical protein